MAQYRRKKQRMSTLTVILIVLVISFPVTGIIAAFALPAYQDYITRTKIMSGMVLASGAQHAVEDYVGKTSSLPTGATAAIHQQLQIPAPNQINSAEVTSVSVADAGVITIQYGIQARDYRLTLEPTVQGQKVTWRCYSTNMEQYQKRFLPVQCR